MSLPEDSHPAGSQVCAIDLRTHPIPAFHFGEKCSELWATLDPDGCSWNLSRPLSDMQEENSLGPSYGTWPRSGMMSNGIVSRLTPLAHLIRETAYSSRLISTAVAHDGKRPTTNFAPGRRIFRSSILAHLRRLALDNGISENTDQLSPDGKPYKEGLYLSPWFAEWLFGLPPDWSSRECRLSAMEFSSRLPSSVEPEYLQLSLF